MPRDAQTDDMLGLAAEDKPNMAWMITFADLVSLMLTFFVLLYSMSTLQIDKWEEMTDNLSKTLNPSKVQTVAAATAEFNIGTIFRRPATNLDYLSGVLTAGVRKDPLLAKSHIMLLEDRLVIALPGDLLFPPGKAEMPEEAQSALFTLGGMLSNVSNQIGVNGHTDPVPPGKNQGFTSNWELSMARASAVANSLRRSGYTDDIFAYGYADSRFQQLPDMNEAERSAMGRRVDVIILSNVGGQ